MTSNSSSNRKERDDRTTTAPEPSPKVRETVASFERAIDGVGHVTNDDETLLPNEATPEKKQVTGRSGKAAPTIPKGVPPVLNPCQGSRPVIDAVDVYVKVSPALLPSSSEDDG